MELEKDCWAYVDMKVQDLDMYKYTDKCYMDTDKSQVIHRIFLSKNYPKYLFLHTISTDKKQEQVTNDYRCRLLRSDDEINHNHNHNNNIKNYDPIITFNFGVKSQSKKSHHTLIK